MIDNKIIGGMYQKLLIIFLLIIPISFGSLTGTITPTSIDMCGDYSNTATIEALNILNLNNSYI